MLSTRSQARKQIKTKKKQSNTYNETDELIIMHDSFYNLALIKLSILIKINIDYVEQSFTHLFDSNLGIYVL